MTKKDFIALADHIRWANRESKLPVFGPMAIAKLADFCASTNPRFNRGRWLAYIAGEVGLSGGKVN